MIGEVRTRETMEYAMTFAETGHLCLATLHANNANQALDRIMHFFPHERQRQLWMDLSLNLKAIVAQQLVPTPDGLGRKAVIEVLINTPLVSDPAQIPSIPLLVCYGFSLEMVPHFPSPDSIDSLIVLLWF